MKPSIHEDTLGDLEVAISLLEGNTWRRDYNFRWAESYIECISCGKTYYENATEFGEETLRTHEPGCQLEAALPRLRAFVDTEQQLHNEAEEKAS